MEWHRCVDHDLALDVLDVRPTDTRSWRFVWSGRIVVQHHSGASTTAAAPPAAVVMVPATPGSAFRVLFEHPEGPRPQEVEHAAARLGESPAAAFRAAVAGSEAHGDHRLPRPIAQARALIEQHLHEDLDLGALSQAVGLDRSRLCRLFQKLVGLPPQRYRAHLRVARARKLLATGVDCIEVAHTVGFFDQSHLNRWFKGLTGTTPGLYASACRITDARRSPVAA